MYKIFYMFAKVHLYRPQKKLREGNIFTGVCLFTRVSHVTITHDALDLTVPTPPQTWDLGTYPTDMEPGYLPSHQIWELGTHPSCY